MTKKFSAQRRTFARTLCQECNGRGNTMLESKLTVCKTCHGSGTIKQTKGSVIS